jgi:hypothetical protein
LTLLQMYFEVYLESNYWMCHGRGSTHVGYDTRKFVATDIDEKKIKKERELELIYAWYTMFTAGGGLDMRLSNLEEFCVKTVTNVLRHCA